MQVGVRVGAGMRRRRPSVEVDQKGNIPRPSSRTFPRVGGKCGRSPHANDGAVPRAYCRSPRRLPLPLPPRPSTANATVGAAFVCGRFRCRLRGVESALTRRNCRCAAEKVLAVAQWWWRGGCSDGSRRTVRRGDRWWWDCGSRRGAVVVGVVRKVSPDWGKHITIFGRL